MPLHSIRLTRPMHCFVFKTRIGSKNFRDGLCEEYCFMLTHILKGGTSRAQWEDVTGSTPLTFVNDCVSFTTTVSARFWLMDCRNISDATKMATELYRYVTVSCYVYIYNRLINNDLQGSHTCALHG